MEYQVRRCDGPDGSSAWKTHSRHRTLLGALRAIRDVRQQGAAAYLRGRLVKGAPWHGYTNSEVDRWATQYRITGWLGK